MTSTPNADPPTPLWRPIPLASFSPPARDARQGLLAAWRRLRRRADSAVETELSDPEPMPADVTEPLVPEVDLEAAAESLEPELEEWLVPGPEATRSVVLVGPPGSAVAEVLDTWAADRRVERLAGPSADTLERSAWQPELPEDRSVPLLLPPLERLFLRTTRGLDGLRRLLARLQRERRMFAAACDGWAWSFLSWTLSGRTGFDRALTPAPFDAAALRRWFVDEDCELELWVDGSNTRLFDPEASEPHEFLRVVAAHARGNPGVAAALWRMALSAARVGAEREGVRRCELPRWQALRLPEVSGGSGKPGALVLHALLLHGGLDEERLGATVPLTRSDARNLVWELHGQGIVTEHDGLWRVSLAGHPAVRSHLAALGLPLDEF